MYTQAMQGCHPVALDYANKMIEVNQNAFKPLVQGYSCEYVELYLRQERAVIFRLMGKWDEALKELEHLLEVEQNYACNIQVSYLKSLMGDTSGALDYARRAKKEFECDEQKHNPGYGTFSLGFKALPDDYRKWVFHVDQQAQRGQNYANHVGQYEGGVL